MYIFKYIKHIYCNINNQMLIYLSYSYMSEVKVNMLIRLIILHPKLFLSFSNINQRTSRICDRNVHF